MLIVGTHEHTRRHGVTEIPQPARNALRYESQLALLPFTKPGDMFARRINADTWGDSEMSSIALDM